MKLSPVLMCKGADGQQVNACCRHIQNPGAPALTGLYLIAQLMSSVIAEVHSCVHLAQANHVLQVPHCDGHAMGPMRHAALPLQLSLYLRHLS